MFFNVNDTEKGSVFEALFDVAANGFFQSFSTPTCHPKSNLFSECRQSFSFFSGFCEKLFLSVFPVSLFPPAHFRATKICCFRCFLSAVTALTVIVISLSQKCFSFLSSAFSREIVANSLWVVFIIFSFTLFWTGCLQKENYFVDFREVLLQVWTAKVV